MALKECGSCSIQEKQWIKYILGPHPINSERLIDLDYNLCPDKEISCNFLKPRKFDSLFLMRDDLEFFGILFHEKIIEL